MFLFHFTRKVKYFLKNLPKIYPNNPHIVPSGFPEGISYSYPKWDNLVWISSVTSENFSN